MQKFKRAFLRYCTSLFLVGLAILALVFVPFDASSDGNDLDEDDVLRSDNSSEQQLDPSAVSVRHESVGTDSLDATARPS